MHLHYESHYVTIELENIHLQRIYGAGSSHPVVFMHGSIENGKIFYTRSGKGIAPYLAENGMDCYVVDLPGRGLSTPKISGSSDHGLPFYIEKVIPSVLKKVRSISGYDSVSIVAHSWGGVIVLASLAIAESNGISSLVFFGTKRKISISSLKKFAMVDIVWRRVVPMLSKLYGYYPAREFRIGSDNETITSFLQTDQWVVQDQWKYFETEIDIADRLKKMELPPLLSLTGNHDDVLGHPTDVKQLLQETGSHQLNQFVMVGKSTGFQKNYDHITLLTDPLSKMEVFPKALSWIRTYGPRDIG